MVVVQVYKKIAKFKKKKKRFWKFSANWQRGVLLQGCKFFARTFQSSIIFKYLSEVCERDLLDEISGMHVGRRWRSHFLMSCSTKNWMWPISGPFFWLLGQSSAYVYNSLDGFNWSLSLWFFLFIFFSLHLQLRPLISRIFPLTSKKKKCKAN